MDEPFLNHYVVNKAVEHRKHTLIYFFDDERVSLHFKAISALEWLQDDFYFVSVMKPSLKILNEYQTISEPLPVIRGALAPLDEDEDITVETVK